MPQINAASAVVPGATHGRAMSLLAGGLSDPVLGPIAIDEVQLCPQHAGRLTEDLVDRLITEYPSTRFRIHASPRVIGEHRHQITYASNAFDEPAQIEATAALSRRMGAQGYSLHAGETRQSTLETAFDNVRRLADLFGCRVGLEGLYPSLGRTQHWLLGTWAEHDRLLEAKVDFAIDLSHLNIIAKRERQQRPDLVRDLLSSKHCIEVHVSCNDGRADSHRPLNPAAPPWWMPMLPLAGETPVFYEGVIIDPKRRKAIDA